MVSRKHKRTSNAFCHSRTFAKLVAGPLAPTLASMGIQPRAKISKATWLTYWRRDESSQTDYVFIFNDANATSSSTVTFETSKTPFCLNAWTGTEEPIVEYSVSTSNQIIIPFTFTPGESALVVFRDARYEENLQNHVTLAPLNLGYTSSPRGGISIKIPATSTSGKVTLRNPKKIMILPQKIESPITLGNWKLIAESWQPGVDFYDSATIGTKRNKTLNPLALMSWSEVPGLQNISGIGY